MSSVPATAIVRVLRMSHAEAMERTIVDLRWQMVMDLPPANRCLSD
jgi:hypothetical protein